MAKRRKSAASSDGFPYSILIGIVALLSSACYYHYYHDSPTAQSSLCIQATESIHTPFQEAQVLVVLGTVAPLSPETYQRFQHAAEHFEVVLLIAGKSTIETEQVLKEVAAQYPNVFFLQDSSMTLAPHYLVIGSTLGSHPSPRYSDAVSFLTHSLDMAADDQEVIVLTQDAPDPLQLSSLLTLNQDIIKLWLYAGNGYDYSHHQSISFMSSGQDTLYCL